MFPKELSLGLFGALKVSEPTTHISLTFDKPLDVDREVTTSTSGLGAVTATYNRSVLRLNTTGIGTSSIQTKQVLRYRTAADIETYFTASFHNVGTNDYAYIGLYDQYDGVYLGMKDGNFIVAYRNTTVGADEVHVVSSNSVRWDRTKMHRYRIRFGYLGVGNITYEVMTGTEWQVLHTFVTDANLSRRTHVGSPILPMRSEVNSSSGASVELLSGSWNANTWAQYSSLQDKPFFTQGSRIVNPSLAQNLPVVAFRSKTTFGGYPSKIRTELLYSEFATGSEGLYRINFYGFPAGTITDGAWTSIDTNSVMEVNSTTSHTASGGKLIFSTHVSASRTVAGDTSLAFDKLGVISNPGEEFLITKECLIAGTGDDVTSWNIAYLDLF